MSNQRLKPLPTYPVLVFLDPVVSDLFEDEPPFCRSECSYRLSTCKVCSKKRAFPVSVSCGFHLVNCFITGFILFHFNQNKDGLKDIKGFWLIQLNHLKILTRVGLKRLLVFAVNLVDVLNKHQVILHVVHGFFSVFFPEANLYLSRSVI